MCDNTVNFHCKMGKLYLVSFWDCIGYSVIQLPVAGNTRG